MCDIETEGYARAWNRLNAFPLPDNLPVVSLQTELKAARAIRATYEADVFFDWLEAYPIDIAFVKLAELVQKTNTGYFIEQVQIIGSADPMEQRLSTLQLAARRADLLKRYFVAVGVDAGRLAISTRGPTHEDTPIGRARDRSVALRVVIRVQPTERLQ